MAYDGKCKWCGKTFEKASLISVKSAVQGERKNYCCNKCYNEAMAANGESGNVSNQQKGIGTIFKQEIEPQKTEAEINYEIERRRKEDEKNDKKEEEKIENIKQYKKDGKLFLAFVTEKPGLSIFLFFVLFPILSFFLGLMIFGGGKHQIFILILPMIIFLVLYLKDKFKK